MKRQFIVIMLLVALFSIGAIAVTLTGGEVSFNPSESNITYNINTTWAGLLNVSVNKTCFTAYPYIWCNSSATPINIDIFYYNTTFSDPERINLNITVPNTIGENESRYYYVYFDIINSPISGGNKTANDTIIYYDAGEVTGYQEVAGATLETQFMVNNQWRQ